MMTLLSLKVAIIASVIGYVYAEILNKPGEIFGKIHAYLTSKLTTITYKEINHPQDFPEEVISQIGFTKTKEVEYRKVHWLLKPLGGCAKCMAGQISIWIFLGRNILLKSYLNNYSNFTAILIFILFLIFTVCITVLITEVIRKTMDRL